jgi:HK97 family phage major capsid protein
MATPDAESVARIENRAEQLRGQIESYLLECRANTGDELDPTQSAKYRAMTKDLRGLERRVAHEKSELARVGQYPTPGLQAIAERGSSSRAVSSAGRLAPLHFETEQIRRMQTAAQRQEPCRLESRAFSTADSLLPAQLWPWPIPAAHENRILNRLPGLAFEAPQITFIRHVSTTGQAGPTAEGAIKPELVFNTDALTLPAIKLAANVGLSYEIVSDYESFSQYAGNELYKQIVDVENNQLIQGSGTGGNIEGLLGAAGLTHDCSADTGTGVSIWDSFEKAIQELRSGPALCEPDLLILSPQDWSSARRVKDSMNRFIVAADPSRDEVDEAWGVPVLTTIQCPIGKGVMLSTTDFGYVGVREPLIMRAGYANDDLVRNILRLIGEERLTLCVTKPSAVLKFTSIPAPTAATTAAAKK